MCFPSWLCCCYPGLANTLLIAMRADPKLLCLSVRRKCVGKSTFFEILHEPCDLSKLITRHVRSYPSGNMQDHFHVLKTKAVVAATLKDETVPRSPGQLVHFVTHSSLAHVTHTRSACRNGYGSYLNVGNWGRHGKPLLYSFEGRASPPHHRRFQRGSCFFFQVIEHYLVQTFVSTGL